MSKKKKKAIVTKAKKKEARARARIKKGNGKITINKRNLECVKPWHVKKFIEEPLILAGSLAEKVDIEVNSNGGGFMGQAASARGAIAKALVEYSKSDELKQKMLDYDRMLLVDDSRRKESKKPLGKGARAKKQSSKR